MSTPTDARVNKKLTNIQVFKLYGWLQSQISLESFEPGVSIQAVANAATTAVGFEVNANHIYGGLEQLGLRLPRGPVSDNARIGILKRAVETLYSQLGLQLPPEWADL